MRYVDVSGWDMPTLFDASVDLSTRRGLELSSVSYSNFAYNNLSGFDKGLFAGGTCYYNTVHENDMSDCNNAIEVYIHGGNGYQWVVTDNDMTNSNYGAISYVGVPADISGNDFTGSGGGIGFSYSNGGSLNGNSNTWDLTDGATAVSVNWTNGFSISDLTVVGDGGRAVHISNSHNVTVDSLETCGKTDGVYVHGTNNVIQNSSFSEANTAINVYNGSTVTLAGNTLHNVGNEVSYDPNYSTITGEGSSVTVASADWCPAPPNEIPIADAGPDQTLLGSGVINVNLDGSGSSDADGDPLTYTWSGSFGSTSGETPTVSLAPGSHTVTLTVEDGNGGSSNDDVVITIVDMPFSLESNLTDWTRSTVVEYNDTHPGWPGVTALPDESTYTEPVLLYTDGHVNSIPGTTTIQSLEGIRFYRTEFSLPELANVFADLQMTVDNDVQIFINGHELALEGSLAGENFSGLGLGLYVDGPNVLNGHVARNPFDSVAGSFPTSNWLEGTNELVLVIRNLSGGDRGGFAFRMEVNDQPAYEPPVAYAGPDQSFDCVAADYVDVIMDGGNSQQGNGQALTYEWTIGGVLYGNGASPNIPLGDGAHEVVLTVDNGVYTDTDTMIVNIMVDVAAPSLTILGDNPHTQPPGDYVDVGAEATDNCDVDVDIAVSSDVDSGTLGTYTVTYTATDDAGNETVATREVVIVNQDPVAAAGDDQSFSCIIGGTDVTLDGSDSSDPDGDALSYSWAWDGGSAEGVNPTVSLSGNTVIVLTVDDGFGGTDSDTLSVSVELDETAPVLTILGDNPHTQFRGDYVDAGAEASDECDLDVDIAVSSDVDSGTLGTYTVTYTATDDAGNETVATREVVIVNQDPVAAAGDDQSFSCIIGGTDVTLDGSGSSDPDGDALSYSWSGSFGTVTGVNPTVFLGGGDHTITLTVDDGFGGSASDEMVVSIELDETAPVITLIGGDTVEVVCLYSYDELGADVLDNCDPNPSLTIDASAVDTSTVGFYDVVYTSVDEAGNESSVTRVVEVTNQAPVVANEINGLTLSFGDASVSTTVDLEFVFDDPDGHAMTYTASNGDDGVATMSFDGTV